MFIHESSNFPKLLLNLAHSSTRPLKRGNMVHSSSTLKYLYSASLAAGDSSSFLLPTISKRRSAELPSIIAFLEILGPLSLALPLPLFLEIPGPLSFVLP